MDPQRLSSFLREAGQPEYRLRQTLKALYSGAARFAEITTLPAELRRRLEQEVPILSFQAEEVRSSSDGLAHKARLRLKDGRLIEAVLMQSKPGHWSVCVSSQVGCPLACTFCATGLMGLVRNLTAEEIADQVLFWRQHMRENRMGAGISNVVYMGMGEPMLNFEAVRDSILQLTDPELFGMGRRTVAVSTAGVVPGIRRFAEELPQVHLAVSLHAATNSLRTRLVPLNKAYPLAVLAEGLRYYLSKSNRRVFLEYVLLASENDQPRHAGELAAYIKTIGPGRFFHVNLIVWNPTDTPHRPTARPRAVQFKENLRKLGVSVTLRKNLGQDIEGACGQLVIEGTKARRTSSALLGPG